MLNTLFLISNIGLFLSSIILVTHHDPIKKLLSLISLFFCASLTFLTYNFYFLGLTYLIVYIGAIAILFLFVIMMVPLENLNYNISQLKWANSKKFYYYFSIFLLTALMSLAYKFIDFDYNYIYQIYSLDWFNLIDQQTDITVLAYILFLYWPNIIVLIGILLWLILIGVLYISMD